MGLPLCRLDIAVPATVSVSVEVRHLMDRRRPGFGAKGGGVSQAACPNRTPGDTSAIPTTMLTTCLFALLAAEATALKFTWFQTEGTLELDLKVQCSGPVELKMQCTAPSLTAIVS